MEVGERGNGGAAQDGDDIRRLQSRVESDTAGTEAAAVAPESPQALGAEPREESDNVEGQGVDPALSSSSEDSLSMCVEARLAKLQEEEAGKRRAKRAARQKQKAKEQVRRADIDDRIAGERATRAQASAEQQATHMAGVEEKISAYNVTRAEQEAEHAAQRDAAMRTTTRKLTARRAAQAEEARVLKEVKCAQLEQDTRTAEERQGRMQVQIQKVHDLQAARKERVDEAMVQFYTERKERMGKEAELDAEAKDAYAAMHAKWTAERAQQRQDVRSEAVAAYERTQLKIVAATEEKAERRRQQRKAADARFKARRCEGLARVDEASAARAAEDREVAARLVAIQDAVRKREEEREQSFEVQYAADKAKAEAQKQRRAEIAALGETRRQEEQESFERRVLEQRSVHQERMAENKKGDAEFWRSVIQRQRDIKIQAVQRREEEANAAEYTERMTQERVAEVKADVFWREQGVLEWREMRKTLYRTAKQRIADKRVAEQQVNEQQSEIAAVRAEQRVERREMAASIMQMRDAHSRQETQLRLQERGLKQQQQKQDQQHARRQVAAQLKAESELCRRVCKEEYRDHREYQQKECLERFHSEVTRRDNLTSGVTLVNKCNVAMAAQSQQARAQRKRRGDGRDSSGSQSWSDDEERDPRAVPSTWQDRPPDTPTYCNPSATTGKTYTFDEVLALQHDKRTQLFRPVMACVEPSRELPGSKTAATSNGGPLLSWAVYVRTHVRALGTDDPSFVAVHRHIAVLCSCLSAAASPTALPSAVSPKDARRQAAVFDPLHYLSRTLTGRQQLLHLCSAQMQPQKTRNPADEQIRVKWVLAWMPAQTIGEKCAVVLALHCERLTFGAMRALHDAGAEALREAVAAEAADLVRSVAPAVRSLVGQLTERTSGQAPTVTIAGVGYAGALCGQVADMLVSLQTPVECASLDVLAFGAPAGTAPLAVPSLYLHRGDDAFLALFTHEARHGHGVPVAELGGATPHPAVVVSLLCSQDAASVYLHSLVAAARAADDTGAPQARFSYPAPNPSVSPHPAQVQYLDDCGALTPEASARFLDLLARFGTESGTLDFFGAQLMRKYADGVRPDYLVARELSGHGGGGSEVTAEMSQRDWLRYCLALVWKQPWCVQALFDMKLPEGLDVPPSRANCFEQAPAEVSWAVLPMTETRGGASEHGLPAWRRLFPPAAANFTLTKEGTWLARTLFGILRRRRESVVCASDTVSKHCWLTFYEASAFPGVPAILGLSPSELWEHVVGLLVRRDGRLSVLYPAGASQRQRNGVTDAMLPYPSFEKFLLLLCWLDEAALWRRICFVGIPPSLTGTVDRKTSRACRLADNIHEDGDVKKDCHYHHHIDCGCAKDPDNLNRLWCKCLSAHPPASSPAKRPSISAATSAAKTSGAAGAGAAATAASPPRPHTYGGPGKEKHDRTRTFGLTTEERDTAWRLIEESRQPADKRKPADLHGKYFTHSGGRGRLLVPKVEGTHVHSLAVQDMLKYANSDKGQTMPLPLRDTVQRMAELEQEVATIEEKKREKDPLKRLLRADPPKVLRTSPHLYHPSYDKEIAFDQYVERMDIADRKASVHRKITKKVFGCERRLYDPSKLPVRRETPDPPTPMRTCGPKETKVVENLYTNAVLNAEKQRAALAKQHTTTGPRVQKLDDEGMRECIVRVTEQEIMRRKKAEEALFDRLKAEDDAVTVKRSSKAVQACVTRLHHNRPREATAAA